MLPKENREFENDSSKGVFISYRRGGGADVARIIEAFLDKSGYDVFLDVDSLGGGHFDEMILNQIKIRKNFILICNKGCFERFCDPADWVRREVECAIECQKHIVPVVLEGFDWSDVSSQAGIPDQLRRHNSFPYVHVFWKDTQDRLIKMIEASAELTYSSLLNQHLLPNVVDSPLNTNAPEEIDQQKNLPKNKTYQINSKNPKSRAKGEKVPGKTSLSAVDTSSNDRVIDVEPVNNPGTIKRVGASQKKTSKRSSGNSSGARSSNEKSELEQSVFKPEVSSQVESSNGWVWGCSIVFAVVLIIVVYVLWRGFASIFS